MRYLIIILLYLGSTSGQPGPNLTLKDAAGNAHSLSDYRGKIVVLNFWATWCVPCKDEMPIFAEAYKRYNQRGIVILAASLDDDKTRKYVPKFVRSYKMDFPVLMDATSATMQQIGLGDSLPSTVFFDDKGNEVGKIIGQARKKDVLDRIEQMLARRGDQTSAQDTT